MNLSAHGGSNPPREAEIGDLWLDTGVPFISKLKVKCATEWVTIASLHAGREPHDALFNRVMTHRDA